MKSVVYLEIADNKIVKNSLELITAAKQIGEVTAVVLNSEELAKEAAGYGIDAVNCQCAETVEQVVAALADVAETADLVFVPSDLTGKDLCGRLAGRMGAGAVTDVVEVGVVDGAITFKRPLFGGTVYGTYRVAEGKKAVVAVRSGSYGKPEAAQAGTLSTKEIAEAAVLAKEVERKVEITEEVNLEDAEVVVAGGRGASDPETFKMVEELASVLNGVVGASRPAIEAGLVSRAHQVGQSGKNIAPKLYIACGISGALQHISGVTNADYIVAINKDPDAPIFEIADLGIVGKCEEVLPLMIEEVKKRKNG